MLHKHQINICNIGLKMQCRDSVLWSDGVDGVIRVKVKSLETLMREKRELDRIND